MSHGLILKIDDRTERLVKAKWESFWARVERVQQSLNGQSFPDSADLIRMDRDR